MKFGHFTATEILRFYVKSNFGEFKQSKNVIFASSRGFDFSKFEQLSSPKFTKIQR